MTEITIELAGKKARVMAPESWDALDMKQLLRYYNLLFTTGFNPSSDTTFTMVKLISIARDVLGLDDNTMDLWAKSCYTADPENGETMWHHEVRTVVHAAIGGLFEITEQEDGSTTYAVKYTRLQNPWPELVDKKEDKRGKLLKRTWYFAPGNELGNMTMYEFSTVMSLFDAYMESGNDAICNRLIAVMYRPKKPETRENRGSNYNGDKRMPLRGYESTIDARVKMVETIPLLVRRVMMFWFASCRLKIVQSYPKVFKQSKGNEGPNYGWGGVLLNIAGGPVNVNEVGDQNFHTSLVWLSMKEDEAREMERQIEARK